MLGFHFILGYTNTKYIGVNTKMKTNPGRKLLVASSAPSSSGRLKRVSGPGKENAVHNSYTKKNKKILRLKHYYQPK